MHKVVCGKETLFGALSRVHSPLLKFRIKQSVYDLEIPRANVAEYKIIVAEEKNDWNTTYERALEATPTLKDFNIAAEIDQECLSKGIFNRIDMELERRSQYDKAVGFPCDPLVGSLVVALNMYEGVYTVSSCNGAHTKQQSVCMTPSPVVEFACDHERTRLSILRAVGRDHYGVHGRDGLKSGEIGGSETPLLIQYTDEAGTALSRKTVFRSVYGGKAGSTAQKLRKVLELARVLAPE
jgi:hypothetical protein